MTQKLRSVRIVLVSPGDMEKMRTRAELVIAGLRRHASAQGFNLETRSWKNALPGYRPAGIQEYIQDDLDIGNCDLLLAFFWRRFGVIDHPPYSRTASEVCTGMESKRDTGAPEVITYFYRRPSDPDAPEEAEDHGRVLRFKAELQRTNVLTRDLEPNDFDYAIFIDILNFLDHLNPEFREYEHLSCQVSAAPAMLRGEGYTEPTGDIVIGIRGIIPPGHEDVVRLNVRITLVTNLTNRINTNGTLDARLVSSRGGITVLGHIGKDSNLMRTNTIEFLAVPLGPPGSQVDEIFAVKGLRADAQFLGVASSFADQTIVAGVEITRAGASESDPAIARERLIVGTIRFAYTFVVTHRDADVASIPAQVEKNVHYFTATFHGAFKSAFKTQVQEAAGNAADHGTILCLALSNVPAECTVLATATDIFSTSSPTIGRAIAIQTNASGLPTGSQLAMQDALWEGDVPMFAVEKGFAAWEVVRPIGSDAPTLNFGLAIAFVGDAPSWDLNIASGFGPFFMTPVARVPSATLPVPRFIPGMRVHRIPTEDPAVKNSQD
jgi:hypothetical protein